MTEHFSESWDTVIIWGTMTLEQKIVQAIRADVLIAIKAQLKFQLFMFISSLTCCRKI